MSDFSSIQTQSSGVSKQAGPASEVVPRAKRRRFPGAYKLRILAHADQCTQVGQIGALLRREGRSSAHLTTWRKQRKQGHLQALAPQQRGPTQASTAKALAQLRREKQQLERRLEKTETMIEVPKKLYPLLGLNEEQTSAHR